MTKKRAEHGFVSQIIAIAEKYQVGQQTSAHGFA